MMKEVTSSRLMRGLVAAACITIIIMGMREAAEIVGLLLLSFLLALAVIPLPNSVLRKGLSRSVANVIAGST